MNWDSGHRTNYRVGYQGQYDLTIIDNAQIGKCMCDTGDVENGKMFLCQDFYSKNESYP